MTYFDAFAKDYSESPFLSLSAHIVQEIQKHGNLTLPSAQKIEESSKNVVKKLGSISTKVAVKALTLGLVGASEIEQLQDLSEDLSGASAELAESAADALFDEFVQADSDFEKFRDSLDGLAKALSSGGEEEPKKTVFIIDELDRCRPDFALGILEIIKHLFQNRNVHFLLVTNLDYLVASVNAKYGLGNASAEYLEKFYDFIVFFEQKPWDENRHASATLVENRLSSLLNGESNQQIYDLSIALQAFARGFDLSLRQSSALATNAALAFLAEGRGGFRPPILIAILALFRAKFPAIYQDIKKNAHTLEQVTGVFADVDLGTSLDKERVLNILEFYSAQEGEIERNHDRYVGYRNMTSQHNFRSYRDVLTIMANSVLDNFGDV